jgi:hypothetical protein
LRNSLKHFAGAKQTLSDKLVDNIEAWTEGRPKNLMFELDSASQP